jgi:MFS family permease
MSILLLLISFASVNAVLFTPALPDMVHYFAITDGLAALTITAYLAGYALGQLVYGPLSNRIGRKKALYVGVSIQIISSLLCVAAGVYHHFYLLTAARFILAVGAGCGLKITITMVNETYPPQTASRKISQLMLAFAITPGLGVALGGILNTYFGWMSCFYASACYGLVLLGLLMKLPETQPNVDVNALKVNYLLKAYRAEFSNVNIIAGGILVGMCSCFIYLFATVAPFIAIELSGMSSENFGFANLIPMLGLAIGSLLSAKLTKHYAVATILKIGMVFAIVGVVLLAVLFRHPNVLLALFFPTMIIYIGEVMVLANASTIAMSTAKDKSHGSAVINFIAVGLSTLSVLGIGFVATNKASLPIAFGFLCVITLMAYRLFTQYPKQS